MKIATHNSFTGEHGCGLLSAIGTPFARCQSKNLRQQYQAGARLFDLRIRKVHGRWVGAHGIWHTRRSALDMIRQLASYGDCLAILTYEGDKRDKDFAEFCALIAKVKTYNIHWVYFAVKKPVWDTFEVCDPATSVRQGFYVMGSDLRSVIPIPYVWRNTNRKPFNDELYTLVDFL